MQQRFLIRIAIGAAIAAIAAVPPAQAQGTETAGAADAGFTVADFDGDGKVSLEELRNRALKVFGQMDHNGDGRIAGDEHPPAVGKDGKPVQPGNVTAEAYAAAIASAFKDADKDGDGTLSPKEWSGN